MHNDEQFETYLYNDYEPANAAIGRLHDLGYDADDISVMMNDKTRERAVAAMTNAKGSEGIAAGATIGGALGAIIAALTATGSVFAIAGTGGVATPLVVGPLAAALAGLGAGAATGGVVGGLIGVGVAEKHAKEYERGLAEGGILVAIRPKSKEHREYIRRALNADTASSGHGEVHVDYAGEVRR